MRRFPHTPEFPIQSLRYYIISPLSTSSGCSKLFDESSPYYSSFYGAYLVSRGDGTPFGFSAETAELDKNAVSLVAGFDFFSLVLDDFGLAAENRVFNYSVKSMDDGLHFVGSNGWTRIYSDITINGVNHKRNRFVGSYLQYGSPKFPVSSDFAPVEMKSIVYAKYFSEWDVSVFFYVISPSEAICEECVRTILSQSTLTSTK